MEDCEWEFCRSDLGPATDQNPSFAGELPRKKSRNYLDSHKTIEKKRRDRINQCLNQLKTLVPDCRQYVCATLSALQWRSLLSRCCRGTRNWTRLRFWR